MNFKSLVFKNTIFLAISQLVNKFLLFIFTVFIARYLKESGFGQYSIIVTIVGFFNIFTNFGLGTIAFRDVSKNRLDADIYFSNLLFMRMIFGLVSFLFLCITVNLLKYRPEIITATYIYGLTLFTTNIIDSITSIFNAFERMEYMSILSICLNVLTLAMGVTVLKYGYGLNALVTISVIAGFLSMLIGFFLAKEKVNFNISSIDMSFCKVLIKNSFPLMLFGLLGLVYFRIDIILLSKLKGDADVGLYNAAYKIMDAFIIVSNSIVGASFPKISRYFHESSEKLKMFFRKINLILFSLGAIFVIIVFFFAEQIITLLFGPNFTGSVLSLKILIFTVPLIYLNAVLLYTLIAANIQSKTVIIVLIVTLANFALNIIFIPKYNFVASSIITVVSEFMVFCGYYYLVRKNLKLSIV